MIKIASWNVNSIRSRIDHVIKWLSESKTDILALQETKVTDDLFPVNSFEEIGFGSIFFGQPSYNGVAILYNKKTIKSPKQIINNIPDFNDHQSRLIAATFENINSDNQIRIICIYVPNGSAVGSDKFVYKVDWLNSLFKMIKSEKTTFRKICILGDFNIAPHDIDVHDPEKWRDKILCSNQERNLFQKILDIGFFDSFRFKNESKKIFSWWDYRQGSFRKNYGLRIDHILFNSNLKKSLIDAGIEVEPRKYDKPSDHTACWARIEL